MIKAIKAGIKEYKRVKKQEKYITIRLNELGSDWVYEPRTLRFINPSTNEWFFGD